MFLKKFTLAALSICSILSGCSITSNVKDLGDGNYALEVLGGGFSDGYALLEDLISEAKNFCRNKNAMYRQIDSHWQNGKTRMVGTFFVADQYGQAKLRFRCSGIDNGDLRTLSKDMISTDYLVKDSVRTKSVTHPRGGPDMILGVDVLKNYDVKTTSGEQSKITGYFIFCKDKVFTLYEESVYSESMGYGKLLNRRETKNGEFTYDSINHKNETLERITEAYCPASIMTR